MNDAASDRLSLSTSKPVSHSAPVAKAMIPANESQNILLDSNEQFRIYTYPFPKTMHEAVCWKRQEILKDRQEAIKRARELFRSQRYQRIEIRQSSFNAVERIPVDEMVKVFDFRPAQHLKLITWLLGAAFACMAAAVALTYFIAF